MAKIKGKHINLDPENLFDNVGNLAVKFSDIELADSNKTWSSQKTQQYIDTVAQGLDSKQSCRSATVNALPTCTYSNGTSGVGATLTGDSNGVISSQDGATLVTTDRLLVKNQLDSSENGIYEVTQLGNGSTPFVLTRAIDFDDSPDGEVSGGAFTFIEEGATLSDTGWVVVSIGEITIGTSDVVFNQFSGAGQLSAGVGMTKDGDTMDIGITGVGNYNGINRTANDIAIATGIGTEISSNQLRLSSTGISDGLTGASGSVVDVVSSDIVGEGLEEDGSNNIRIASSAAGDGLQGGSGSALAIDTADFAGTGLEEDGSNDLRIASSAAGDGLQGGSGTPLSTLSDITGGANLASVVNVSTNGVAVKVDTTSIDENGSGQLEVKDGGINITEISSDIAGDGIQGGSGSALAIDVSDFSSTSLEDDGSENLRISTGSRGNGLTGGSGSALEINVDTLGGSNLAKVINTSVNGVAVKVDSSTVSENGSNQLYIPDVGITETQLNTSVAGLGLEGGGGTALVITPASFIRGGDVEVNGDRINIDFEPTGYSPSTTPVEAEHIDDLTAHLYGIDMTFIDISAELIYQEMHTITSAEDSNGYFGLGAIPISANIVRATVVEGNMEVNNAAIGISGATPDFNVMDISNFHFNNNGSASGLSELLETGDILILEYEYQIETGMDSNGDIMPFVGDPEGATNIFEENGPSNIMPSTSGTENEFYEIIGGEITVKE